MTQVTSNSSNALWGKVLRHFELSEGFAFVLLTVADNFTADQYANELEVMLRNRSQKLERLEYKTPESAMEIANVVLNRTPEQHPAIAALWIQALTTASDPTMPAWKTTWQRIGARLNERRDVIRTLPFTLVLVCPEACMPAFRGAAPDLWSVRALTGKLPVKVSAIDEREIPFFPNAIEADDGTHLDPDLAMQAAEQARQKPEGESEFLLFLLRASRGYAANADFQQALLPALESTQTARKLVEDNRQEFKPILAASLTVLGIRFRDLGRDEEALKVTQEAVDTNRELARDNPLIYRPDLALGLSLLGVMFSSLERFEEALTVTQEAVNTYRDLARDNPQTFKTKLADTLSSLGVRFSNLARHEEALKVTQEAVDTYRQIIRDNPKAFKPDLAGTLSLLGVMLSMLGQREEAFTATQEAVDIYRDLARDNPQAFKPDLAGNLNNLGAILVNLRRQNDAITATQEAVDTYRDLARDNPQAFKLDLARGLNSFGDRFKVTGQIENAHANYEEATRTLSSIFLEAPNAFAKQMTYTIQDYLESCEALNLEPDAQLVDPIIQKLNELA